MRHDTFRLFLQIAKRLWAKEGSAVGLQDPDVTSDATRGFRFRHELNVTQDKLCMRVDLEHRLTLELFSQRFREGEEAVFTLVVFEGNVVEASFNPMLRDRLDSYDILIECVIPALGGFEDILTVTDENTVYMLRQVGTAYAQREILRLIAEDAEGWRFEEMQEFLRVCINLDIQYTLKRRRTSP